MLLVHVEFEDAESGSSSEMGEYSSDDELSEMCQSPRGASSTNKTTQKMTTQKMTTQKQQRMRGSGEAPAAAGKSRDANGSESQQATKPPNSGSRTTTMTATFDGGKPARPVVAAKPKMPSTAAGSAGSKPPSSTKPGSTQQEGKHTYLHEGKADACAEDVGSFLGMKQYMDAMDRELANTNVGKSFVRHGDTTIEVSCRFPSVAVLVFQCCRNFQIYTDTN